VGVAAPIDVQVLLDAARCGNGRVGQLQGLRDARDRCITPVEADSPAALPGRRLAEREIAADSHKSAANAEPVEHLEGLAGGVALADGTDVQRHARYVERHGSIPGIQVELAEAAAAGRFSQRGGIGHARGLSRLAPEPDDRPLRDVERAAGGFRQVLRCSENGEQILADGHRAADAGPGDVVQLAVGPVVRENALEISDAIEGGAERLFGHLLARRVNRDPDERAHVRLNSLIAVQFRLRWNGQRGDREAQSKQSEHHQGSFASSRRAKTESRRAANPRQIPTSNSQLPNCATWRLGVAELGAKPGLHG
jgi:hypothetical protein